MNAGSATGCGIGVADARTESVTKRVTESRLEYIVVRLGYADEDVGGVGQVMRFEVVVQGGVSVDCAKPSDQERNAHAKTN